MGNDGSVNWGAFGGDAKPAAPESINWSAYDKPAPQTTAPKMQTAGPNIPLPHLPAAATPLKSLTLGTVGGIDTAMGSAVGSSKGKTLNLWDYITGIPQRAIAGAIVGDGTNPQQGFWQRVHAGAMASIQRDAGASMSLEEHMLGTFMGAFGKNVPTNPMEHAALGWAAEVLTDPVTWAGGGGWIEKLQEHGKLGTMIETAERMASNTAYPALVRSSMGKFAKWVSGFAKPVTTMRDPEGNIVHVERNWLRGLTAPYAKEEHIAGEGTQAYHQMTQARKARQAVNQEILGIGMPHMQKYAKEVAAAKSFDDIPKEVHAWTFMEPALFGDDEMRAKALQVMSNEGIDPKQYDWYKPLMALRKGMAGGNLTKHAVLDEYVPNLRNLLNDFKPEYSGDESAKMILRYNKMVAEQASGVTEAKRAVSFERGKKGDPEFGKVAFPTKPWEAYSTRWEMGAHTVAHRWFKRKLNTDLGIGGASDAEAVQYPWNEKKLMSWVPDYIKEDPQGFNKLMYSEYANNPSQHLLSWVSHATDFMEGIPFLRIISNAMTRGITNNSLPHIFNESRAAWMLGGPKVFVGAIKDALTNNISDEDRVGMILRGTTTNTFRHLPDKPQGLADITAWLAHAPVFRQWSWLNHQAMQRVDDALRFAAEKHFTKLYPDKSPEMIAHEVDEGLGGYMASPAFIKLMRGIGGMFPLWHLRTVPVTTIKAMLKHPERVMALLRADKWANQEDAFGIKKYGYNEHFFGGQAYDTMKAGDALLSTFNHFNDLGYFTSPSAIGQVASSLLNYGSDRSTEGVLGTGMDMGAEYLGAAAGPVGQAITEGLNPFQSSLPYDPKAATEKLMKGDVGGAITASQRLLFSLFGIYPEYYSEWANRVAINRAHGMTQYKAQKTAADAVKRFQSGLGRL